MTDRACSWCGGPIPARKRRDSRFCSKPCRQASHRFGKGAVPRRRATEPMRLAYADPPYPGTAHRCYGDHPDYAGEVDHGELLSHLEAFDGWAISTDSEYLPELCHLARQRGLVVRVASWVRGPRPGRSRWPLKSWEPVVYSGGRRLVAEPADATRDVLVHGVRPRTTDPNHVIGAKPARFAYWLFDLLGARPGDEFHDLFPGSGGIARAWVRYVDVSPEYSDDASQAAQRDGSRA